MKKLIIILVLFYGCNLNPKYNLHLNGRWYYVDENYREVHANDSLAIFFDSKESEQFYQLRYFIENDSFFTIPVNPERFGPPTPKPHLQGVITEFNNDSFVLKKGEKSIVFHKIDDSEEVFEKDLLKFSRMVREREAYLIWAKYHEGYENRARQFYKKNAEDCGQTNVSEKN